MGNAQNKVAIAGVGYSTVGRHLPLHDDVLVHQAVTAAMADAGMKPSDIDGISTYGGDAQTIGSLLGIMPLSYFHTAEGGPAFVEAALEAISAIASGMSHTCIAIRLIRQPPRRSELLAEPQENPAQVDRSGFFGSGIDPATTTQFSEPFGANAPAAMIAGFETQAHMARYGTTEEHFAHHVVAQRYHASMNEDALNREILTIEDYLNSRYISKPVRLFDCDYPCDAASVVIFTTPEHARDFERSRSRWKRGHCPPSTARST